MLALFGMISNAVTLVIAWFLKFTSFSNSASVAFNFRQLTRASLLIAFKAFFVAFIAVTIAFFYYAITSIAVLYNLISDLFLKIQNAQGDTAQSSAIIDGAFHFLHVSGIANGLETVFPIIASAILFRMTIYLYSVTKKAYDTFQTLYVNVVGVLTAS